MVSVLNGLVKGLTSGYLVMRNGCIHGNALLVGCVYFNFFYLFNFVFFFQKFQEHYHDNYGIKTLLFPNETGKKRVRCFYKHR